MSINNDALAGLATVRDETRLQAHLLSMEARERWAELELELDSLEGRLTQAGERASESAVASARDLAQTVLDFFKEHVQSQSLLAKPVAAIMSREVRSCSPDDSLNRAAQMMWEGNCGALPVVSHEGLIVGMITDRDVCMASYTQGQKLSALTVESAMSSAVRACEADEPISRVLEIMEESRVRRVPVIRAG
ncbi:MAG TPA: CBS domain-containing protein [Polyangiaceae bacterium]